MAVHDSNAATIPSTEFRFTNTDGLRVACAHWHTRAPCAAVVQIGHGMGEHIGLHVGTLWPASSRHYNGWIEAHSVVLFAGTAAGTSGELFAG